MWFNQKELDNTYECYCVDCLGCVKYIANKLYDWLSQKNGDSIPFKLDFTEFWDIVMPHPLYNIFWQDPFMISRASNTTNQDVFMEVIRCMVTLAVKGTLSVLSLAFFSAGINS